MSREKKLGYTRSDVARLSSDLQLIWKKLIPNVLFYDEAKEKPEEQDLIDNFDILVVVLKAYPGHSVGRHFGAALVLHVDAALEGRIVNQNEQLALDYGDHLKNMTKYVRTLRRGAQGVAKDKVKIGILKSLVNIQYQMQFRAAHAPGSGIR